MQSCEPQPCAHVSVVPMHVHNSKGGRHAAAETKEERSAQLCRRRLSWRSVRTTDLGDVQLPRVLPARRAARNHWAQRSSGGHPRAPPSSCHQGSRPLRHTRAQAPSKIRVRSTTSHRDTTGAQAVWWCASNTNEQRSPVTVPPWHHHTPSTLVAAEAPPHPPQPRAARNRTGAAQRAQGEEEGRRKRRSEGAKGRSSGAAAVAAVPPRLYSSGRGTALATNSGSLAPAHDSSTTQEVVSKIHRQFSSSSPRTVISPPLPISSDSHLNRLFTRIHLYIGIAISTHGRNHYFFEAPTTI